MSKPKNFPEELLDYAQCYLYSGLTLSHQFSRKPPYTTILNHSKGYLLCSHFLMAHGIELYLKFLIKLLGHKPPSNTHRLGELIKKVNQLLKQEYKKGIFNKEEMKLVRYLDRYEKFRYPLDKNWNMIPDMFHESKSWTKIKSEKFNKKFERVIRKLNDTGYRISKTINRWK